MAPIILLVLLAWLPGGCGKGDSASSAPAATSAPTPAGEDRADRYCLWLLWSRDQALTAEVRKGRPFMLVAREVNLRHPGQSTLNADCLPAAGLDPDILAAVKDLVLGEASPAFALRGDAAIAMRTTDRHRRRGQSLYEQGNLAEAEKALWEDLRLHPASAPTWHLVALIRARGGDKEGALRAFDQALLFAPRDTAVMNDKASTLNDLGRVAEAQALLYEDALRLDPANPTLKANLAWGLAQEAVAAAPEQAAMRNTLGRVQQARGELGAAVASFHRAARLDPKGAASAATPPPQEQGEVLRTYQPEPITVRRPWSSMAPANGQAASPAAARVTAPMPPAPPPGHAGPAGRAGPSSPQDDPAPGFYLQVSSYFVADLAQKEAEPWRKRSQRTLVEPLASQGKIWHRVMLGPPYASREQAQAAGESMKARRLVASFFVVEL